MPQINLGRILEVNEGLHDNVNAYVHPCVVQSAGNDWYKSIQDIPIGIAITNTTYWILAIDNTGNAFDYIVAGAPTETSNPLTIGATWVDKQAGRIYVCVDNAVDNNIWVSQYFDPSGLIESISDLAEEVLTNEDGDVTKNFSVKDATTAQHAVSLAQLQEASVITQTVLTADAPVTFTNIPAGFSSWAVELTTAGFTVTWDAEVEWDADGVEPEWTTGSDLVYFYTLDGGTTIKGMMTRAGA